MRTLTAHERAARKLLTEIIEVSGANLDDTSHLDPELMQLMGKARFIVAQLDLVENITTRPSPRLDIPRGGGA